MIAESAVEALKALHVKTRWTFNDVWNEQWDQYQSRCVDGCRVRGGRSMNATVWPCDTRRILDLVEREP